MLWRRWSTLVVVLSCFYLIKWGVLNRKKSNSKMAIMDLLSIYMHWCPCCLCPAHLLMILVSGASHLVLNNRQWELGATRSGSSLVRVIYATAINTWAWNIRSVCWVCGEWVIYWSHLLFRSDWFIVLASPSPKLQSVLDFTFSCIFCDKRICTLTHTLNLNKY